MKLEDVNLSIDGFFDGTATTGAENKPLTLESLREAERIIRDKPTPGQYVASEDFIMKLFEELGFVYVPGIKKYRVMGMEFFVSDSLPENTCFKAPTIDLPRSNLIRD